MYFSCLCFVLQGSFFFPIFSISDSEHHFIFPDPVEFDIAFVFLLLLFYFFVTISLVCFYYLFFINLNKCENVIHVILHTHTYLHFLDC